MIKRDRVIAAINMQEPDKIPSMFSFHFPEGQKEGEECVKAHLKFFRDSDTDIVKIMNENLVRADFTAMTAADYGSLGSYSINDKFMQDQLDLTKRILDGVNGDEFTCGTLHGMTASAIHPIETRGVPYEQVRQMLCTFLREDKAGVTAQLNRICDVMCELGRAYIEAGLDSVYFASLGGEPGYFTDEEFHEVIEPLDKRIIKAIKEAGGYVILHICKGPLNMERYRGYSDYADAVNWGVYEAPYSLKEGRELFPDKCVLGGLKNHGGVLQNGTSEEIKERVHGVISAFGRKGFILGADCTIPTDTDMWRLKAAIDAARE